MKKLIILLLPVVAIGGAAFKLTRPKPVEAKPKVEGNVYVLRKPFLINARGGRYAQVSVALVLGHGSSEEHGAGGEGAAEPAEGYGDLPQEALVREIVTESLTGVSARRFISSRARKRLEKRVLRRLHESTDVGATGVFFTDVVVQ